MMDETTDEAKLEQVSFVIRYVNRSLGVIEKGLFEIHSVSRADAASLESWILEVFTKHGLRFEMLVGQSYDGASVMRGRYTGVQRRIMNRCEYAYFTHCAAHRLHLIAQDASSNSLPVEKAFGILSAIHNFFSRSTLRRKIWMENYERILADIPDEQTRSKIRTTQSLSSTRWFVRHHNCKAFTENFSVLADTLEQIGTDDAVTVMDC